jgi:hypothetical protein
MSQAQAAFATNGFHPANFFGMHFGSSVFHGWHYIADGILCQTKFKKFFPRALTTVSGSFSRNNLGEIGLSWV